MCKIDRKSLIKEYLEVNKRAESKKKEILKKLSDNKLLFINDNIQEESNLCIILSCPGEQELIQDRVCAGEMGENLEKILKKVKEEDKQGRIKAGKNKEKEVRYSYTIINSVNTVHFRGYNGAEATKTEITEPTNIKRIEKELGNNQIDYIIICGNNAAILYKEIGKHFKNAKCAYVAHLGCVGLRNTYTNNHNELKDIKNPKDRDNKRLKLVADDIKNEFGL